MREQRKVSRTRAQAKANERARLLANHNRIVQKYLNDGVTHPTWNVPDDMPDWMATLVCAGKMCGHKLKDGNGYCRLKPVPHQEAIGRAIPHRCMYHGGAVPVRINAVRERSQFGFYSSAILPEEEEEYADILKQKDKFLDAEIAMMKLRLNRALRNEALQNAAIEQGGERDAMALDSYKTNVDVGPDGVTSKTERTHKLVDWDKRITSICNSIVRMLAQKQIMEGAADLTPEERAAETRAMLREARKSMGLVPASE